MASLADWFAKHRPQPKFFLGDRVTGRHGKMPWVGTVMNDHMVNEQQGPVVRVWLDLPLKIGKEYNWFLTIPKGKGIRYLPTILEETPKKVAKKTKKSPKTDASCINKNIHTGTLF